jgi:tetratricopeptide (TPR) repeat protein
MLFPDGLDKLPRLSSQNYQAFALNTLAAGYQYSGQPGRAIPLLRRINTFFSGESGDENFGTALRNLSASLQVTGGLRESEKAARRALKITRDREDRFRESISLSWLGLTLAAVGEAGESEVALQRSLAMFMKLRHSQGEGVSDSYLAQRALWLEDYDEALSYASHAWQLAQVLRNEGDLIEAIRRQGEGALGLDNLAMAEERLHHALTRARAVNNVEEELPALAALAELRRRQGAAKAAREFLEDVWEYAERGPYPLLHADALNVLAQIGRDAGNTEEAIKAATKAYELAWCDGPPYAYHWGLIKARKHLKELGAPLPEMKPFNEADYEPMPEVEIDPEDEFHVGEEPENS